MLLEERTFIAAPPEQVFAFFADMADNYLRWHPDHIAFRWVDGSGLEPGVVFAFEEIIGGQRMTKRVRFIDVVPDRALAFEPTSRLLRLILPRIGFTIEPRPDGCDLVASLHIRTGPVGAWLNRRELMAVRQHMKEEGENLKRIVEGGAVAERARSSSARVLAYPKRRSA